MSKKNQPTPVELTSLNDDDSVLKLTIRGQEIGLISEKNSRFEVTMDGKKETTVRSVDEAIEYLIARYNLQS